LGNEGLGTACQSGGSALISRALIRTLAAVAALAAAVALAGCDTDVAGLPAGRALAPLSDKMLAELERKNMTKESPILVRLFKEESELEVWKQDNTGKFELLKTYPICRWSGELGPKIREGDRQAPEGFYAITPGLMNPNSNYYLAINTGFPNAYDRANGRTGDFLMIHGDCSSRGCYAMTDEQIAEIYALARESFFGGQRAFQIQAYPFRMTPINMAKHRDSPHMAFWRMLKEGYDHFEVTHLEPKVDVCEKRYVFDAAPPGRSSTQLHFNPAGKCPDYEVPAEIASPVKEKQQRDEVQIAQLISHGTPTVPVRMGTDGGMNSVFLAAVEKHGTETRIESSSLPGTIPANIRPPGQPVAVAEGPTGSTGMSLASTDSRPASAPRSGSLFESLFSPGGDNSANSSAESGGVLDRMSRAIGLRGAEPNTDAAAAKPKPPAKPAQTQTASAIGAIRVKPQPAAQPDVKTASASAVKPQASPQPASETPPQPDNANGGSLINGGQPSPASGTFDSHWNSAR
jgi:murein L,D-transpeptidase YafK